MARRLNSKADELVLSNQGLVRHIVTKNLNVRHDDIDDYVSIGNIGLIKAANTFDESKGIKFSTYASRCITNEIFMQMRKEKDYIYLDDIISIDIDGNNLRLFDIIPDPNSNLIELFDNYDFFIECFNIILNALNSKERLVLLYSIAGYTQRSIGNLLNISQSYTSRLEKAAIRKLESYLTVDNKFEKFFLMSMVDDLYQIEFSPKDIQQLDKMFANILQTLESCSDSPDIRIFSNKQRIKIQFPAEPDSFSFIAKIIQEIDESSIACISNENTLISANTVKVVTKGNRAEQIRSYILNKKSFSVKEVKDNFPDISTDYINSVIQNAIKRGLIERQSWGKYIVTTKT
ncbi:MAG: sigma-70 family RNA polymerase sigma factor [Clostridia bacterium]|nr:sigma-70 family RNA polymerase sigma factor [Clostridia bacterium]